MKNAYLHLENHGSPLLRGLEDAPRIIHGVHRLEVTPFASFIEKPLTLIPSYPDLPMEMVYPRVDRTDTAEVYLREIGKGRVLYFNWDIDRTFWEVLSPDHGLLLRNAVDWGTRDARPVFVDAPGAFDVTVWRQKDSLTVHLVNLTNPMMMKGPFRELIPVNGVKVRLRLPRGIRTVSKVQLLAAETRAQHSINSGYLEVQVPSVLDHEIIAVDL